MIRHPLPPITIAGSVYEVVAVGADLATLTLRRAGEEEPCAVVSCRDAGVEFAVIHRGHRMSDHAEPLSIRPPGIVCPCGGRYDVTRTYRTRPGTVTRYRVCRVCRARAVTRETVMVSKAPPPIKT